MGEPFSRVGVILCLQGHGNDVGSEGVTGMEGQGFFAVFQGFSAISGGKVACAEPCPGVASGGVIR